MKRTIRLAVLLAMFVGLFAYTAHAALVRVDTRKLTWRTGVNTSADTGYVILDGLATTVAMDMYANVKSSGMSLFGGGTSVSVIPDSIFLTFKATDVATGADDSLGFTISYQPCHEGTWGTPVPLITMLAANPTSSVVGFGWSPKTFLGGQTATGAKVIADQYRYIFDGVGSGAGATDSTYITDFVERRFLTY